MFLALACVLGATPAPLPPPFDKLVATRPATDRESVVVYARPQALKPMKCQQPCFEVVLEEKAAPLCLVFDEGPSEDPTFVVYPRSVCSKGLEGAGEPLLSVGATTFVVPGNGFVYSSGFTNNYFTARRKFEVKAGKVREVRQPFYFVGGTRRVARTPLQDDTEPVKPIVLRAEKNDGAAAIATLTEGAEVELLLSDDPTSGWFLVRTGFGLVGWYHSPAQSLTPDSLGLFFNGD